MRVTILGAGTTIPAERYSPSGLYVRTAREHLLFDAGPGTLQRLHHAGGSWHRLDRLFLSHFHLDHCLDLATILFAFRMPEPARRKPLTIYGPRGLKRLYTQLNRAFNGWLKPKTYRLTLCELGETTLRLNGSTVRALPVCHSTPALGYRLEAGGKSLAYSGDSDLCCNVATLGQGADLLILECSHPDERKVEGHLTPTECGQLAAEAGCRRLALTHFYPVFQGYDIRRRVRRHFRGPLTLARDFTGFVL